MELSIYLYNFDGVFNSIEILHRIIDLKTFSKITHPETSLDTIDFEIEFQNMNFRIFNEGYIIEFEGDVISELKLISEIFDNYIFTSKIYLNTHGTIIESTEYEIITPFDPIKLAKHIDKINKYNLISKLLKENI